MERFYRDGAGRLGCHRREDTGTYTSHEYYDELGSRLHLEYEPEGNTKAVYFYDADRNVLSVNDGAGRKMIYNEYDQYNRLTRTTAGAWG